MTDITSPETQEQQLPTPQEILQKLWNNPESWREGMTVQIKGLPEGFRAIETQNETLIIRAIMPGLPEELDGKPLRDVPIGAFNLRSVDPEEIDRTAREFTNQVVNKEVMFVPPAPKEHIA